MGITWEWDDEEQTIIRFIFDERWKIEEYFELKPKTDAIIAAVEHPVGGTIEIPGGIGISKGVFSHIRTVSRTKPGNLKLLVVVTNNLLYNTLLHTATRLAKGLADDYAIAPSIEEARTIIHKKLDVSPKAVEDDPKVVEDDPKVAEDK